HAAGRSGQAGENETLVRPRSPRVIGDAIIDIVAEDATVDRHIDAQVTVIENGITRGAALEESHGIGRIEAPSAARRVITPIGRQGGVLQRYFTERTILYQETGRTAVRIQRVTGDQP